MVKNVVIRTRAINLDPEIKNRKLSSRLLISMNFNFSFFLKLLVKRPKKNKFDALNFPINNFYSDKHGEMQSNIFLNSCASVEKNMINVDSTILKIHNVKDFQSLFKLNYMYIRNFWHDNYPMNLLYIGGDVFALKSFSYPNQTELAFEMFNYASYPTTHHSSRAGSRNFKGGNGHFEHYMNCDIRFYGANMSESMWEVGDNWYSNWQNYWEYEQDLWNAIFRESLSKTGSDFRDNFRPRTKYGYQLPINEERNIKKLDSWNKIKLSDANLIHLHSSRNLMAVKKYLSKINYLNL